MKKPDARAELVSYLHDRDVGFRRIELEQLAGLVLAIAPERCVLRFTVERTGQYSASYGAPGRWTVGSGDSLIEALFSCACAVADAIDGESPP